MIGKPYGTIGIIVATDAPRADRDARGGRSWRADRATLAPPVKDADGRIRGELVVARVGTLEYDDPSQPGGVRVEHVDAETLNDESANESLKLRPLVWEHPPEDVTPENTNDLRIGQLGEKWRFDGEYLIFPFVIDTEAGLSAIRMGLRETSPGYTVSLVKRGDGSLVQRDRRYNHHAITVAARGGPDVLLRADSGDRMDPEKILALVRELRKDSTDPSKLDKIETAVSALAARLDGMTEPDGDEDPKNPFVKVKKDAFEAMTKKCDAYDAIEKSAAETKRGDSDDALAIVRERRRLDALALSFGVDEKVVESAKTSELRLALAKRIDSSIDEKAPPADAFLDGVIATASKVRADSAREVDDGGLDGLRFDGAGRRNDAADTMPDLMAEQIAGYKPKA